jgi:hypothetical protein
MTIANIVAEARALVDATSSSFPDATMLRRVNQAYEEVVGKLIALDRKWKFDDSNYSDLPIGTGTLVASQQDYAYDSALLSIERVEVKDNSGNWHKLEYIDEAEITEALAEYLETAGLPEKYALRANSIFLYPAPSAAACTLASGLKIYFQRTASLYTCTTYTAGVCTAGTYYTGTREPGFASPYHVLLAYKAALPYALTYKKDRVNTILAEISRLETEMLSLASNKMRDNLSRMVVAAENNR